MSLHPTARPRKPPMPLDTSYQTHPGADRPPPLSTLRSNLIAAYAHVGPTFA